MSIRSNVDPRSLDQRIMLQRKTTVQDASGDLVPTWHDLIECWAKVDADPIAIARAEPDVGGGVKSESNYTVWIRADIKSRFALTVLDRFLWQQQVYNIADIPDQQLRGRLVALVARTGLSNG